MPVKRIAGWLLLAVFFGGVVRATSALAEAPSDDVMDALKEIQDIVGQWEGSGKGGASEGWDEKVECAWKFNKSGKVSLYLTFADKDKKSAGRVLDEAMITYDPSKKVYSLKAYRHGADNDTPLVFEGKKAKSGLLFDRVNKGSAKDAIDRIDLKVINDGDRIVYTTHKRVGQTARFQSQSMVALDRQGASLAGGGAKGPKCVVTGGAGTMTVSYNGKTYYVCCTGCRETFLADPTKFVAKLDKKD